MPKRPPSRKANPKSKPASSERDDLIQTIAGPVSRAELKRMIDNPGSMAPEMAKKLEEKYLGAPGIPDNDNVVKLFKDPDPREGLFNFLGKKKDSIIPPDGSDYYKISTTEEAILAQVPQPKPTLTQQALGLSEIEPVAIEPRTVSLMRDHHLTFPGLFMHIYVSDSSPGDMFGFSEMFARASCKKAMNPDEADLVVFTGGVDVDPALYGEEAHGTVHVSESSQKRDALDIELYLYCLRRGIPMMGICRGAQFLHVMNGGKLFQHIDNHYGDHPIWDLQKQKMIEGVSSVHHQAVEVTPGNGMVVIATSNVARNRWRNKKSNKTGNSADVEAYFYPDTCCIGIQGHPEYSGYPYFTKWSLELIKQSVVSANPDVHLDKGVYRLKDDVRKMRGDALPQSVQDWLDAREPQGAKKSTTRANKPTLSVKK